MSSDKRTTGLPMLGKILVLLENIKDTEAGKIVFDHVQSMLYEVDKIVGDAEQNYTTMLEKLLDVIASQLDHDESLSTQIRLVRQRLEPPVAQSEINEIRQFVEKLCTGLSGIEMDVFQGRPGSSITESERPASNGVALKSTGSPKSLYQQHLQQKNQEIGELRDSLARHVQEAIAQNDQFGVLLGVELEALKDTQSIKDVDDRRTALIDEVERLIERHGLLSEKFSSASKYLSMIEFDNQQLSEELDRVRLLSLTDELTTLPNRRAFLRRLEDEIGRVRRYGYPISMILIDLDRFKSINDKYGHAGGDAVLKSYADEVLTIFRHHDMVARYGGEEFAVILPNTEKEGAMSALKKVQEGVAQIFCMLNNETISMPTFSAGLSQYIEGESLEQFIERTDEALYRAKHLGRNRIELASEEAVKNNPDIEGGFSHHHA